MIDWQPIDTVPTDGRPLRFLRRDRSEFDGTWAPYWCGSDCPCDVANEGMAPLDDAPACWCAYEAGSAVGEADPPTRWRPAAESTQNAPAQSRLD